MKWLDNILSNLRSWFSLDENATDSEIHEAMEKAGGLDGMRSQIKDEVAAEKAGEITKLQNDLTAAKDQVTQLQADLKAANDKNTAAQNRITELEKRSTAEPTGIKSEGEGDEVTDDPMPVWKAFQKKIEAL